MFSCSHNQHRIDNKSCLNGRLFAIFLAHTTDFTMPLNGYVRYPFFTGNCSIFPQKCPKLKCQSRIVTAQTPQKKHFFATYYNIWLVCDCTCTRIHIENTRKSRCLLILFVSPFNEHRSRS